MWRIARAKRYENREGAEDIVALAACELVGAPLRTAAKRSPTLPEEGSMLSVAELVWAD
jgi:hypothetical protein